MRTRKQHPSGKRTGCSCGTKKKRRGKEIKEKNQITDHRRINSISKVSQQWGEGREGEGVYRGGRRIYFHPFAMAAYFFVLIPPRLLTSKAPALWRSRTECDWEIWSIFSQNTHLPRGDGIWFFLPPSASFMVSQWTSGFVPRSKS